MQITYGLESLRFRVIIVKFTKLKKVMVAFSNCAHIEKTSM